MTDATGASPTSLGRPKPIAGAAGKGRLHSGSVRGGCVRMATLGEWTGRRALGTRGRGGDVSLSSVSV